MLFAVLLTLVLACSANAFAAEDWPMWRGDAKRSAAVDNHLPSEFKLQWSRHFTAREQAWDDPLNLDLMTYDRVFEPIVHDGILCIGFNDQDKLVALDAATGATRWTYYAEAPVRLPPVGWNGKIYFCSDDGYLYCVNADDGTLHWRFRGAPNAQHAIGNRRLTSAWPARGGPVVYDGKVYFAASIWPFMGTFLYALDAETGTIEWVNDRTGAQYIKQPHSAPSFAGVAPQGAIVATEDLLIVPGGRSVPAVFDRHTGELKYFEINAGGKGTGGSFVSVDAQHFYVHTREKGTRAFNLASGLKTAFTPNEPVTSDGFLYSAESIGDRFVINAYDVRYEDNTAREPIWEVEAGGRDELILAGDNLVAADGRTITIIQIPTETNAIGVAKLRTSFDVAELHEHESIARLLVANKRLIVVGDGGTLCVFGEEKREPSATSFVDTSPQTTEQVGKFAGRSTLADALLELGSAEGYAFWYGRADESSLMAIAENSPFVQVAVVDHDEQRVAKLRSFLDKRGILGRVTAHTSTAEAFRAPKYVAHMVFVSSDVAASDRAVAAIYESVRPYGGKLVILDDRSEFTVSERQLERIKSLGLEQASCQQVELSPDPSATDTTGETRALVVTREGALPGSADWTHQYGDVANSVKSNDSRVKLPLGILWFGGSSNMDVLPRHGHGPPEQVVGGRLFIQGMNSLSARDVYTGRVLWKREFQDLGTFDIYYDLTYENTPLDTKYNQVHIPGANGRGTNYVVTEDRIYLLVGATCLMLDPATGKDVGKIELPTNEDGSQSEWGYLGVYDDVLLGGIGFANYRDRYQLQFDSDKKLKKNRTGYGSKSIDRAASRGLVAFDRHTGEQLWQLDARHSFWHNGIVAGGGRVYCLDKNPKQIEQAMRRRGLGVPDTYRIVCVDIHQGAVQWEVKEGIFGTWLGYSSQHELLLQAGAEASDRLAVEVGQGMRVYRADTGALHWKNDDLDYAGPCILHNDLIITNANSYSASSGAFYLTTGEQKMVKHPLTGKLLPWTMTRAYGCNNIIASENLLTFRSGAAGYYDLTTDSGTGNLGGFKSGCTSNLVVANGVLNAPDYTRTCSCAYQNQTSLALVHMPDVEVWSVNALANAPSQVSIPAESTGQDETLLESVGINLGAAGDRRDADGVLWLEYPVKAGVSPPFKVQFNSDAQVFAQHSASRGDDPRAWISSSGIDNLTELTLELNLDEEIDLAKGLRISHTEDDAEESPTGEVDLASSDLEMTDDEGSQTIGLRFATVPLPRDCKIKEAYLQFTCDEESTAPTSLWIAGERSADAKRFSTSKHNVTSRHRTEADVGWSPLPWTDEGESDAKQRSPDISKIVREIIAQSDWQSGNAMAFIVSGEGQRTAVASHGSNKEAAKLIVIAELDENDRAKPERTSDFAVQLIFAAPRDSHEARRFDIYAQDTLVATDVEVSAATADAEQSTVVNIPSVAIARSLKLSFAAKRNMPLLSGVRLTKRTNKATPNPAQ